MWDLGNLKNVYPTRATLASIFLKAVMQPVRYTHTEIQASKTAAFHYLANQQALERNTQTRAGYERNSGEKCKGEEDRTGRRERDEIKRSVGKRQKIH